MNESRVDKRDAAPVPRWPANWALLMAVVALSIGSCRTTTPPPGSQEIRIPGDTLMLSIIPGDLADSYRVVVDQKSVATLLRSTEIQLVSLSADSTVDRITLRPSSMGAPGRAETVTTSISGDLPSAVLQRSMSMHVKATINGQQQMYPVTAAIDTAALDLVPSMSLSADGTYRFTLRVTRRNMVAGEYFPSSEQLRVTIVDRKGSTVWASNDGMAYLSIVMPVEPQSKGAQHEYTLDWGGTTSGGDRVAPGQYTAHLTLPVRPQPYSQMLEVNLP